MSKAYRREEVAVRNKALSQYAREKGISYGEAIRRGDAVLEGYEPYLAALRKRERNFKRASRKFSKIDEKKIMAHIQRKQKLFQLKALKRRQEREKKWQEKLNRLIEASQKMQDENVYESPIVKTDEIVKGTVNSETTQTNEKKSELACTNTNVLETYSKTKNVKIIIIDDDEAESEGALETLQQNEIQERSKLTNQCLEINLNNINTEGLHNEKYNVNKANESRDGKQLFGVLPGNHSINTDSFKYSNISQKCSEPVQIRNVEQVIDFLKTSKGIQSESSTDVNPNTHGITKNVTHEMESLEPTLRETPYKQNSNKVRLLENESTPIDINIRLMENESAPISNNAGHMESETTPLNNYMLRDGSNHGILTIQVSTQRDVRVIIFPENEKKDKYMSGEINQKIPHTVKHIHRNDSAAPISIYFDHSSKCIVPDCSHIHGQNNLQKPYTHGFYNNSAPEKQLHNEKSTQTSSDHLINTMNDYNLTYNIRNYENYFTRSNINYDKPFKDKPTTMEIKPTSTFHDDLKEIYENVFDEKFNQEVKGEEKTDAELIDLLDIYLPTATEDAGSNGSHRLQEGTQAGQRPHLNGTSEWGAPADGGRLRESDALETFTDDVYAVSSPGVVIPEGSGSEAEGYNEEAGHGTRNVKKKRMEMYDSDAGSERRAKEGMFKSTVENERTHENISQTEGVNQAYEEITSGCVQRADVEMIDSVMEIESKKIYDGKARSSMKQYANEGEYEHSEEKNSDGYQEMFYDDVFISNDKPTMYLNCLLT